MRALALLLALAVVPQDSRLRTTERMERMGGRSATIPKTVAAPAGSSLLTGLVAYWPLSGDMVDVVTGAYSGAVGGHNPSYTTGHLGAQAIQWTPVNGLGSVVIPSLAVGPAFSFRAWVLIPNPITYTGSYGALGAAPPFHFYITNITPAVTANANVYQGGNHASSTSLAAGSWAHVVMTSSGSLVKFYLNGVLDSSTYAIALSSSFTLLGATSSAGGENISGANATGALQQVAIWSKVLTQAEVTEDFNGGAGKAYPFSP